MKELNHPYVSVQTADGHSYGGDQNWSDRKVVRQCGCGVVAAADLLLYLQQNRTDVMIRQLKAIPKNGAVPRDSYLKLIEDLRKGFFPLIPRFGTSGVMLAAGLNGCFLSNRMGMRAKWCVQGRKLWERMEAQLGEDIPVICSIGTNIPFFWMKHRVRLYIKGADGIYRSNSSIKAHYVTVTGLDRRWMRVSSWGKEYYISREEYERYVQKYSSFLVSNMVGVTVKK